MSYHRVMTNTNTNDQQIPLFKIELKIVLFWCFGVFQCFFDVLSMTFDGNLRVFVWPNFHCQKIFFLQVFKISIHASFLGLRVLLQSGRSSLAKHGDAYFSAIYGFMKDPIVAPRLYKHQEV